MWPENEQDQNTYYELSENQKKNGFSMCFWGELESAGISIPSTQATSRSPC